MGAIRLILALSVALAHIDSGAFTQFGISVDHRWSFATGGIQGIHAVILFYVISGFLMSYVLEHKYVPNFAGTVQFYLARMLRIYPLWIILNVFVIAIMGGWGVYATNRNLVEIAAPFLLLGSDLVSLFMSKPHFPYFDPNLFLNATGIGWTLGAEVGFYVLAPFLFRSPRFLIFAVVVSLGARIGADLMSRDDMFTHGLWMYFVFPTTLIFFLLGHIARLVHRHFCIPKVLGWTFLAASLAISIAQNSGLIEGVLGHISVVLFALSLPTVFEATKDNVVSNFLGDLTYPLYLFHLLAIDYMYGGYGSFAEWGGSLTRFIKQMPDPFLGGFVAMGIFSGFVILVAAAVHLLIEKPLTVAIVYVARALRRLTLRVIPGTVTPAP